jgi:6-pyruvoyltetrahydropterin/6-carboxytetrahydropterin synthase
MFEIFKEFRFEAAHALAESDHSRGRYTRLHGHSYRARAVIRGEQGPDGWVMDLGALEARLATVREALDHHFLNEVADLGPPTLENLARFIWARVEAVAPGLHEVAVFRDSCGEGCFYRGPEPAAGGVRQNAVAADVQG